MNIKRLFEKTSTGLKEFVAKVDFANVIGLSEELAKYIKKDSDNEANVNYVNSTRDKTLTVGYDGINYINYAPNNTTLKTHIYDNIATFHYSNNNTKVSVFSTVTYDSFQIRQHSPSHISSTTYRAKNIARDNFTYTFPDKSGTIELVDEDKDNKLNHIELVDGLHNSKYCSFVSFKNVEELIEYVNNNKGKITEAYTIYNDENDIHYISLGTDGALVAAHSGLNGFTIMYGNLRNDGNATLDRTLGFTDEGAIFPSNLQLITDSNEVYSLNLAKCIELGIVTKDNTTVQISNTNLIV